MIIPYSYLIFDHEILSTIKFALMYLPTNTDPAIVKTSLTSPVINSPPENTRRSSPPTSNTKATSRRQRNVWFSGLAKIRGSTLYKRGGGQSPHLGRSKSCFLAPAEDRPRALHGNPGQGLRNIRGFSMVQQHWCTKVALTRRSRFSNFTNL